MYLHAPFVDSRDALREIQGHAGVGNIRYTAHARTRMAERAVSVGDVRCALVTATAAIGDNGAWCVDGGRDLDGEGLTVVVAIDRAAVVVTVF